MVRIGTVTTSRVDLDFGSTFDQYARSSGPLRDGGQVSGAVVCDPLHDGRAGNRLYD
jgi:hypothetical protein